MLERKWKTMLGEPVADIREELRQLFKDGGKDVHVGTDSQQNGVWTDYVTVLVVLTPSKGGRAFYTKERVTRIRGLRERLSREAYKSTELAMELTATPDVGSTLALMDGDGALPQPNALSVHLDINPDARHKSSQYVQELVGLVVGQGFKVLLKPDSWAASHAADHAVRGNVEERRLKYGRAKSI